MRFATMMLAGIATAALLSGGEAKAGATADNVKSKGFVQCGVNVSGLIFFGWIFLTVGSLKHFIHRKKPE